MNAIVPVSGDGDKTIGYLTARALGDQFDRILESLPRSNNIRLSISEFNPDTPQRHGMILYSDDLKVRFNQPLNPDLKFSHNYDKAVWQYIEDKRFGSFLDSQKGRYYFREFYPYNNQLVSWILVIHLDTTQVSAPFQRIRFGLLASAFFALIISLLLANIGARNIAEPITHFAGILKRYADGESKFSQHTSRGADELKQLDHSFHYLVDTLEKTQQERDSAQKMMLQSAKLASIGEMAAGIGHEINNPLNNILSYATLIERDLPADKKALLDDIHGLRNEAQRAGKIVKGILNFARQLPPEYTEFDLHVWLKDTMLLAQAQAHKYHVRLIIGETPDIHLHGDRNQLQQVLVNLLMNAIQASTAGDTITVSALADDKHITITVSDQGTGIKETDRDKIFDPFFSTKGVGEGSGLGLSISIGIMQYHHGQLKLENNQRGGVDAMMILPLKPEDHAT